MAQNADDEQAQRGARGRDRQEAGETSLIKPNNSLIFDDLALIPTRSCQMCFKQFCLCDLARIIWIAFIIQMVWAI